METIYNTYVVMESQEQCDRMKQLCIDNRLRIWISRTAFKFDKTKYLNIFHFDTDDNEFYIATPFLGWLESKELIEITEQEFIELLKTK